MAISIATGPDGGPALVAKALADLGAAARFRLPLLPGQPRIARPTPIYNLSIGSLTAPYPFSTTQLVGWRYLVRMPARDQIVDLAAGDTDPLRFHALHGADYAKHFVEACQVAEAAAKPEIAYSARDLRVASIHLEAVWLAAPAADIFVPIRAHSAEVLAPIDLLAIAKLRADQRAAQLTAENDRADLGG